MSLRLYELQHSPYCIPIAQALRALGQSFERVEVPNWDRSVLIRVTGGAYYQVPVIEHDGRVVHESGADTTDVAAYVDGAFGEGQLFPDALDGLQQILVAHIENEVEGATFKVVDPFYVDSIEGVENRVHTIRYKERKFGRGCVEAWRASREALRAQADALLDPFERMLSRKPFLFGERPVYADFALLGIVGNMTYRGWNELSPKQGALRAWRERLEAFRY